MKAVRKRPQLPAAVTAVTVSPTRHHELPQRIAALNELTARQLRDEWRRLYRGQPPRLSRDLANPHYRLSHPGACLRRVEQGDPAQARRVDQGTEEQGKYRGDTRYVPQAGHAGAAGRTR